MSNRSLTVLGSASQAPTRHRNHNGYAVRLDDQLFLFDPGEGTQRQATIAGVSIARLDAICITHFHGDHCLGLPGVIQSLNGQAVTREIAVYYPGAGQHHFDRLRYACDYNERTPLRAVPVNRAGSIGSHGAFTLTADALDHRTTTFGYRIEEPSRRHMIPSLLEDLGLFGPIVGELAKNGVVEKDGREIRVEDVSEVTPGQVVSVVLDTRPCDGARRLAEGADLLIAESTFLDRDGELAERYGHMTARQAGRLAAEAGARSLVLTHFSQRYRDPADFVDEAASEFDGQVTAAADFEVIDVPR